MSRRASASGTLDSRKCTPAAPAKSAYVEAIVHENAGAALAWLAQPLASRAREDRGASRPRSRSIATTHARGERLVESLQQAGARNAASIRDEIQSREG